MLDEMFDNMMRSANLISPNTFTPADLEEEEGLDFEIDYDSTPLSYDQASGMIGRVNKFCDMEALDKEDLGIKDDQSESEANGRGRKNKKSNISLSFDKQREEYLKILERVDAKVSTNHKDETKLRKDQERMEKELDEIQKQLKKEEEAKP